MFGLKWSLWPVPTWLAVENINAVFILTFYNGNNNMKHFQTVFITPQTCNNQFWLLIAANLALERCLG